MDRLKKYAKTFIEEEDGMEFMQFAIIVIVTVLIASAIIYLATQIGKKIGSAGDSIAGMGTGTTQNTNPFPETTP